jgi:hypothetical protein
MEQEEFEQAIQVDFKLAPQGRAVGPTYERRLYRGCTDEDEAVRRIREEFPKEQWRVWDTCFDRLWLPVRHKSQ